MYDKILISCTVPGKLDSRLVVLCLEFFSRQLVVLSQQTIHAHIYIQKHNDAITTSGHSPLEKYTSHFIRKGSKVWRKVLLCERWVGDWTERQHIDPHSSGYHSLSFLFSWATQPGAWAPSLCWDMVLIPASSLQLTQTFCAPSYIIVLRPLNSNRRQSRLSPDILDRMHLLFTQVHFLFWLLGRVGSNGVIIIIIIITR